MKIYQAKSRVSKGLRGAIDNVLEYHERYKKSYFWSVNQNAAGRRREEGKFNNGNPPFEIEVSDGVIKVIPSLSLSCKNVYYSLEVIKNDEKKNITLLKKLAGGKA